MRRLAMVFAVGVALTFAALSDYEDMSAVKKLDYLWQKIMADTSSGSFMNALKTLWIIIHPANLWAMTKTHSDWREPGHEKATHGVGAVAKAHFEWKKNEYSGMFQQADNCVIRMANAAAPGGITMGAYGPNLAVKCLRDGVESANMQFIWELDGFAVRPQGARQSCSYFETPLANHNPIREDIAASLKDTFCKAFQAIDPHSMWLGLSQMASATQKGTAVEAPHFPFALVMKPASGLNEVPCTFNEPISQLLNIDKPQTLYDIYASRDPCEHACLGSLEMIGSLVLDTPFTASRYGDTELFFRHVFFQEEIKLVEPARAAKWSAYANNPNNTEIEGAHLYWPLLPGGPKEMAELAAKPQMLDSDTVSV